jgi:hypothetical protein
MGKMKEEGDKSQQRSPKEENVLRWERNKGITIFVLNPGNGGVPFKVMSHRAWC